MGVKVVYFINEWDGFEWHKKLMSDGDSIVIINYNNEVSYHEWRVINGELVDTVGAIMNEFSDELNSLNTSIETESEIRKSVDDQLLDAIRNEGIIRKNNDITPGEYVLQSNETLTLPTNSNEIPDVKINVADDFFNFGTF